MKSLILCEVILLNMLVWSFGVPIPYLLILNIVLGTILLSSYLISRLLKKLQLLQLATYELLSDQSFSQLITIVEMRIEQLLECSSVFIFWQTHPSVHDWKKGYYHFVLQDAVKGIGTKPTRIIIDNVYGEKQNFYYYPIEQEDYYYGSILISLKKRQRISKLTLWFLKHITMLMINEFKLRESKSIIEADILQELQMKLSQDLHDGLAQKLFFLSAQIYCIKKELHPRLTEVEVARMKKLAQQVEECVVEVRNYMHSLRDNAWHGDLFQDLEHMLRAKSLSTGLQVHLHTAGNYFNETYEVLKTIYQIVDESSNNVIKHAKATKIQVSLEVTSIQWTIRIADDGIGLPKSIQKKKSDRMGLAGIEERLKQVGGFLSIRSDAGEGTELVSIIPRTISRERGKIIGAI